jgi:transposase
MRCQLVCVRVTAVAAGVAAVAVAVLAVLAAVVAVVAVVAAVAVDTTLAEAAVDAPVDAPATMNPVRIAPAARPATPVTRRARRAGCGRRRRAVRGAATGLTGVSLSVFTDCSSRWVPRLSR